MKWLCDLVILMGMLEVVKLAIMGRMVVFGMEIGMQMTSYSHLIETV